MLATAFQTARSPAEVLLAADRFFLQDEVSLETLGRLGIRPRAGLGCLDDLEECIAEVRVALDTLPLTDRDEEGAMRMLGYLMLASMRARQLS